MNGIGRDVKAVDEGPDDGVVRLSEGRVDVSVGEGAVARAEGLDVICMGKAVPILM